MPVKLLGRYVLREHLAPFLFAFLSITFLLVIDYVPKIVNHVIDKDLSVWVALELVGLNLAWMLALSVPMSVLVATLMAFGRMTADFEITAMKASGINILRIMLPVFAAGCLVTFGMIQFNDKILPDLNKKARELWGNITHMRPTLIFRSGVFITDIPGYLVYFEKIDHATSRVDGVRINVTKNANKSELIVAEYGFLKSLSGGSQLQFTLHNGEIHSLDVTEPDNYRRIDFKQHVINIGGTGSELHRTDSDYRTDREMGIDQMNQIVERSRTALGPIRKKIHNNIRSRIDYLFSSMFAYQHSDTLNDSSALAAVKKDASTMLRYVDRNRKQISAQQKNLNQYALEIQKKYSIPAASLAFILIGAPLGIMSRRGGMGVSMAISIVLFTLYWASLIGGEDLADRGFLSPFWAMWSANFLVGGIGCYLLYTVVTERQLFSWFRAVRPDTHD